MSASGSPTKEKTTVASTSKKRCIELVNSTPNSTRFFFCYTNLCLNKIFYFLFSAETEGKSNEKRTRKSDGLNTSTTSKNDE